MKNQVNNFILIMLLLCGLSGVSTFASWMTVGDPGFSADYSEYHEIAIDNNDTVYVVYRDRDIDNKAIVQKFNGTSWGFVGTPGFSAGQISQLTLAIDSSNVPYVGYQDEINNHTMAVQKFNGTNWEHVGDTGFPAGQTTYNYMAL